MTTDHTHVVWHSHSVSRLEREKLNGHEGCVVWFTGLSGSGKSTVANLVDRLLHDAGVHDPATAAHPLEEWLRRQEKFGIRVEQRALLVPPDEAGEVMPFSDRLTASRRNSP